MSNALARPVANDQAMAIPLCRAIQSKQTISYCHSVHINPSNMLFNWAGEKVVANPRIMLTGLELAKVRH